MEKISFKKTQNVSFERFTLVRQPERFVLFHQAFYYQRKYFILTSIGMLCSIIISYLIITYDNWDIWVGPKFVHEWYAWFMSRPHLIFDTDLLEVRVFGYNTYHRITLPFNSQGLLVFGIFGHIILEYLSFFAWRTKKLNWRMYEYARLSILQQKWSLFIFSNLKYLFFLYLGSVFYLSLDALYFHFKYNYFFYATPATIILQPYDTPLHWPYPSETPPDWVWEQPTFPYPKQAYNNFAYTPWLALEFEPSIFLEDEYMYEGFNYRRYPNIYEGHSGMLFEYYSRSHELMAKIPNFNASLEEFMVAYEFLVPYDDGDNSDYDEGYAMIQFYDNVTPTERLFRSFDYMEDEIDMYEEFFKIGDEFVNETFSDEYLSHTGWFGHGFWYLRMLINGTIFEVNKAYEDYYDWWFEVEYMTPEEEKELEKEIKLARLRRKEEFIAAARERNIIDFLGIQAELLEDDFD